MLKRIVLATAAAFAFALAAPALAGEGCANCAHAKEHAAKHSAAEGEKGKPCEHCQHGKSAADADKGEAKKCDCEHCKGDCKCGEGCKCPKQPKAA